MYKYILFERLKFSQLLQIDDVLARKKPCKEHERSKDSPVRCQQGVEGRDSLGEVSFVEDARQTETILTEILMIPAGTVIEECPRHCSSQTKYPPCFSR